MTKRTSTTKVIDEQNPLDVGCMFDYLPEILRRVGAQVSIGCREFEQSLREDDDIYSEELHSHMKDIEKNLKEALESINAYHEIVYGSH